jgi:hypothetical protein
MLKLKCDCLTCRARTRAAFLRIVLANYSTDELVALRFRPSKVR